MSNQKLFMIHCGFYEEEVSAGIYEFHINIPIAASDLQEATWKVRSEEIFQRKKMHIDGVQELTTVSGFRIELVRHFNEEVEERKNHSFRDFD